MKRNFYFLTFLFFLPLSNYSFAQSLEWNTIFSENTNGGISPINPTSAKDSENSVFTTVAEFDTMKISKHLEDGTFVDFLDTEIQFSFFTPITNLSEDEFAVVFGNQLINEEIYLLTFNSNLQTTRFSLLDFQEFESVVTPQSLFMFEDELYLTILDGQMHQLYKITDSNQPELIYEGEIETGYGESFTITNDGNFVFTYLEGNMHLVRCVSPQSGSILWEHTSDLQDWRLRKYSAFSNANHILKLTHDIEWVGSDAIGTIKIIQLNSLTGEQTSELELFSGLECIYSIYNLIQNESNGHLYMAYFNSCDDTEISLVEIDPTTGQTIHSITFDYVFDELNFGEFADLVMLDNGQLAFVYKSYANETELGNLFIVRLLPDFTIDNVSEINFSPRNGSEAITHFLPIENSKFLITGILPNNNPSIGIEIVNYYVAMIDNDGMMATQDIENLNEKLVIFPNPSRSSATIVIPERGIGTLSVYDLSGKKIYSRIGQLENENSLSVKNLQIGNYIIGVSINGNIYHGRLLVN